MVSRTQNQMRLVLRLLEIRGAGFGVDGDAGMNPLGPQENRKRDDHEIVLVLAENAADFFHHSDH